MPRKQRTWIHRTGCHSGIASLVMACTLVHAQTLDYPQAQRALQSGQSDVAFRAFQKLAQHGDPASQFQLSLLYRTGRGVAPNPQQSLHWLKRAAGGGYSEALSNLGGEYSKGQLLRQDKVKALTLFLLAQAKGLGFAATNAQTAARMLSPAQVTEAQTMAEQCLQASLQPCL